MANSFHEKKRWDTSKKARVAAQSVFWKLKMQEEHAQEMEGGTKE